MSLRPLHPTTPIDHPESDVLFNYAERLADGRELPAGDAARHIECCDQCNREVQTVRRSIELLAAVPSVTPSRSRTAGILLAARNERRVVTARRLRQRQVVRVSKGFSVAAAAVLTVHLAYLYGTQSDNVQRAAIAFPNAHGKSVTKLQSVARTIAEEPAAPAPVVTRNNPTEFLLRAAVLSQPAPLRTAHQELARRKMQILDADSAAAMEALKRNPALASASRIVMTNSHQVTEELWDWYVKRPL